MLSLTEVFIISGLIFSFLFLILWIFHRGILHRWEYRNPYDRTCKVCGRHEVEHCRDFDSWNKSWWEVFDDGRKNHWWNT